MITKNTPFEVLNNFGTPGRSRTYNHILRTDLLYPVELPGHDTSLTDK